MNALNVGTERKGRRTRRYRTGAGWLSRLTGPVPLRMKASYLTHVVPTWRSHLLASKAHRVTQGLVGGCALLLGVVLSGCAAPQFTYVANSSTSTYFKVPYAWHKISDSSLSSELKKATGGAGGGWKVAYEAGHKPTAGDFLSFGTAQPFVFAEVGQLNPTASNQL